MVVLDPCPMTGEQRGRLQLRRSRTGDPYLAGEDDDLVDRSSSLVLQELADDETAKGPGPDDGEILVPGHVCR